MALRVIGAGLPRTGTTSLRAALERLLGGPCYHMFELHENVDAHGAHWWAALEHADLNALDTVLDGYVAAVDWPASLFWRDLAERHPSALVVLSHRGSDEAWWRSVDRTVWASMRRPEREPLIMMFERLLRARAGLGADWDDEQVAMQLYRSVHDEVVASVAPERLLIWQPSDGWEPLCAALGAAVPEDDFFHLNPTEDFRARARLDDADTS